MKWNSVQAAVCRNKRQNLLQTSKFVPGISRSKSTWNFEVPVVPEILQLLIVTGREAAETEVGAKPVPIKTVQSRRISSCFNSLCIYTKPDRSVVSVI